MTENSSPSPAGTTPEYLRGWNDCMKWMEQGSPAPSAPPAPRHVCGVAGFDGMQGDVCPACSPPTPLPPLRADALVPELLAEAIYESQYALASITRWAELPASARAAYLEQACEVIKFLRNRQP